MIAPVWAAVPAAGVGRRFGGDVPKQYLPLAGRTVLEHSVARLLAAAQVRGVAVAVSPRDARFDTLALASTVLRVPGGDERADSVLAALDGLRAAAAGDGDWVLVHDAVRPCLHAHDLAALIEAVQASGEGALLGAPVRDTMKRAAPDGRVSATVSRDGLWHALTPQMFRLGELRRALLAARGAGITVTDEAQAMEHAGFPVRLVAGRADNIKITRREDLALAAWFLERPGAVA